MDFFFFVFIAFLIFVCCSLCGFCCRKKESGAIYTTPVMVTSETHQIPGQSQVIIEQTTITSIPPHEMAMPMAYQPTGPTYPPSQPYPTMNSGSPYPPTSYPISQASAPYPNYPPQAAMNPPSYNDIMTQGSQQPYPPMNSGPSYPPMNSGPSYPPMNSGPSYPPGSPYPASQPTAPYPTKQEPFNPSYPGGN